MKTSSSSTPAYNLRVFAACFLSFMTLLGPIIPVVGSIRAADSRAQNAIDAQTRHTPEEKLEANLFMPVATGPLAVGGITATKTDSFPDPNSDGKAAPGEEITYTVDVSNTSGADATGLNFTDTIDKNTTLLTGFLKVSPLAFADTYAAAKDTPLSVSATGVLANDTGLPVPTAVPLAGVTTTGGGNVTLNADGSFNYSPAAGFTGADTFTYTATNGQAPISPADTTALVTVNVDAAPTVANTTPPNGATNQATNTNITITFSEPVNLGSNWLTISCASSGTHNTSDMIFTGGPTTWTINPNTDFTEAETCTVNIVAAQVTDQDTLDAAGADTMAADYSFNFTLDAAPTATMSNPGTNAAINSNITINFNEPVTVNGNWFTISCTSSGAHAAAVSGSSPAFTLDPVVDFNPGETCTVTVLKNQVADQDVNDPPNNMANDAVFTFLTDIAPTVTSTTPSAPANTGIPINNDITINFSEEVTANTNSFSLKCPAASAALGYTLSTSPSTSFTLTPTALLPAGTTCQVMVIAAQIHDTDMTDPPDILAGGDYIFSFTTDFAPTVIATTPADAATKTANNTDLTITFSEPVDVIAPWFTISCATSGTHTAAVTGGPTTFTLNPDADFANGEICTVTIHKDQVADQDTGDPPDKMAADNIFAFTVDVSPTIAPVNPMTPASGALNIVKTSNININFSENVTATTNSFSLECPAGPANAKTFTVSGSGTSSITLDPTSDMPPGAICTVKVIANQISDTDAGDPPDNLSPGDYTFSFGVKPDAVDDSLFTATGQRVIGNVSFDTANIPYSVNSNDVSISPMTITAFDANSANGGTVTMTTSGAGMGLFKYNPPRGFEGTDTFNYTISSAGGSNTATVAISVSGMIWFINNNAGVCSSNCNGRLSNAYTSLAAFNSDNALSGGLNPDNNDNIFVYESSTGYSGAVSLRSGQKLIGQDATAGLAPITGVSVGSGSTALPAINSGNATVTNLTSTLTLNTNTTVRGLSINSTTSTGINDPASAITGVNVSEVKVTTTTGTAVSMSSTGGTFSFISISAMGATNGISLANTTGSFTVTGNSGGLCGGQVSAAVPAAVTAPTIADCTGGHIQNTTGAGILLNNTSDVSLTRIWVSGAGNDGIGGTSVNGFTLVSSLIENNGNAVEEAGLDFDNLFGASSITNSTIRLSHENNIEVRNTSTPNNDGSQATLTLTGCTINNDSSKTQSTDGVLYQGLQTANMSITVSGCALFANRGDHLQASSNDTVKMNAVFMNNTLTGGHATGQGQDIVVNTGNTSSGASFTYDINGNSINGAVLSAITATLGAPSVGVTMSGRIRNNTIGTTGVVRSGSVDANGIAINQTGGGTHTVSITGNTIRQWKSRGISAAAFDASGNLNLTVQSNMIVEGSPVNPPGFPADGTGGREAVLVIAGSSAAGDINVVCLQLGGSGALANNVNRGPEAVISGEQDIRVRQRSNSTFRLPGYAGGTTDLNAVQSFLAGMNTSSADGAVGVIADVSGAGGGFVGGASCATPSAMYRPETNLQKDLVQVDRRAPQELMESVTLRSNTSAPVTTARINEPFMVQTGQHTSETFGLIQEWMAKAQLSGQARDITSTFERQSGVSDFVIAPPRQNISDDKNGNSTFIAKASLNDRGFETRRGYHSQSKRVAIAGERRLAHSRTTRRQRTGNSTASATTRTRFLSSAQPLAGDTVNHNIGILPAGKSVRITFRVTVNTPFSGSQVSNHAALAGNITSATPFSIVTDDPETAAPDDATVTQVLGPPDAIADYYTTFNNTPLNVPAPGVLINDLNGPTAIPIAGGPTTAGGTVTLNADGSFSYTPPVSPVSYPVADSFTYTAANAAGTDTTTVEINVSDTSAIYLNEVLSNPPGVDAPNQYIELRGVPNALINAGTYLVAIEGDAGADSPGDVQTLINLSGLKFGANGFLVLLQTGNTYTTDAGASVYSSSGTLGFSGLSGGIFHADGGATDVEGASVTFMLVQTGVAPTLADDIDSNDDGTPDGTVYAGWSIRDSVGVLDGSDTSDRAYGALNYSNNTGTNGIALTGTTVILNFTASYVGRIGNSISSTTDDWAASGALLGVQPDWTLGLAAETEPVNFSVKPLNHIGASNFVNLPPLNQVPGAQNIDEDESLVFKDATQISISDSDAGNAIVQVRLTAVNGAISLSGTTNLTFTPTGANNDGMNDAQMIFAGTIGDINTALKNLTFAPPLDFNSPPSASLTIETNDLGNTGAGGNLIDSDTVQITVGSINDQPSFTLTGNPPAINEDAGTKSVNSFATNISQGQGETGQTLSFNVSPVSSAGNLSFMSSPTIDPATGNLTYTTSADTNGTATFNVTLSDNGNSLAPNSNTSGTQQFTITVNPVNDQPTANAQALETNEETPIGITLIGSDTETTSGNLVFTVTLPPVNGVLSGSGANLTYTPNLNYNGPDSFKFIVADTGDGASSALSSTEETVSITVNAVNDAPVNNLPFSQSAQLPNTLIFSAANTNLISVSDDADAASVLQVTLSVTSGTITLSSTSGLAFTTGDGISDTAMTLTGTLSNINSALAGLAYTPALDFDGTVSLTIETNDLGNTGGGVALSDKDAVQISVTGRIVQFSSPTYTVNEADGHAEITLTRSADTSTSASVNYQTNDHAELNNCNINTGDASQRCDYTGIAGTANFAAGQATTNFIVPIINDVYVEGPETLTLTLSNPAGISLSTAVTATLTITDNDATVGAANPIDDPSFFVRQHYLDFLNREPEPSGFADWLKILNNCPAGDTTCDLVEVSSGFFRSPEFFDRAYFIFRFYEVAFGRKPTYEEYQRDLRRVAGFLTPAELETRKQQFAQEFTERQEFLDRYQAITDPQSFIAALSTTAGVTPGNQQQLVLELTNGTKDRAQVLRAIVESNEIADRFYNTAFVGVGYFAFLRREPDSLYLVWIDKLNSMGDFRAKYRELIRGFIGSQEYRSRFGQP